jgi:hypothetical protein
MPGKHQGSGATDNLNVVQAISLRGREINADGQLSKHPHNEIV